MVREYQTAAEEMAHDIERAGYDGEDAPDVQDVAMCYMALQFERIADALEEQNK